MINRKHSSTSTRYSIVSDSYFEFDMTKERILHENNITVKLPYLQQNIDNFSSSIFMIIAVFLFSFVNLGGKLITSFYPEIEISTVCIFRGFIPIIFGLIYVKNNNIDIKSQLKKDYKLSLLLFLRCFVATLSNYTLFQSFKFMRISSAFTIFNTSPIFTSIISIFIFNSKFNKFDIFDYLVCFVSVCFITKPGFLSIWFNIDAAGEDTLYGIFLATFSSVISGIGILLNKYVAKDFHFINSTILYGVFFIVISLIYESFKHLGQGDLYIFENFFYLKFLSFVICVMIGVVYYFNTNYYIHSLNIGDPIIILPLTYLGIVLNLIYNSFIFGKVTDFLDIVGSMMIVCVNLKRILNQRKK